MMEIIHYSETLASTYKSTWNYNPEDKKWLLFIYSTDIIFTFHLNLNEYDILSVFVQVFWEKELRITDIFSLWRQFDAHVGPAAQKLAIKPISKWCSHLKTGLSTALWVLANSDTEICIRTHKKWCNAIMDKWHVEYESSHNEQNRVQVLDLRILYDRCSYQINWDHQHHNWNDNWHLQQT
jgi:hypothetical protein